MEITSQDFPTIRVNSWTWEVSVIELVLHLSFSVFVYNYAMEDYGTVNVETILDIMKVMSYAMKQGKVSLLVVTPPCRRERQR